MASVGGKIPFDPNIIVYKEGEIEYAVKRITDYY